MRRSPRCGNDPRRLGATIRLGLKIFVLALSLIPLCFGNAVRFRGPLTQVDKFATFRTERPVWIVCIVKHRNAALRAMNFAKDLVDQGHHRLQKVSWNVTSSTLVRRCAPTGDVKTAVVKRMLSAYLFALISGTQS